MVALKSLLQNEDIALVVAFFFQVPQNNNESTMHKHNGLLGFVSAWEDISTAKKKRVWVYGYLFIKLMVLQITRQRQKEGKRKRKGEISGERENQNIQNKNILNFQTQKKGLEFNEERES